MSVLLNIFHSAVLDLTQMDGFLMLELGFVFCFFHLYKQHVHSLSTGQ